ncbi:acyltransferase [Arthrobacter sp. 3Tela_A]|uniref:acyltransferase n=1 Tax=Arthrobacter sp. 3Tela_A TaxID=3093743 RepID=UPI003BB654D9
MVILNSLAPYSDENGNRVLYPGEEIPGVRIEFTGSNNTLSIDSAVKFGKLNVVFDCDNGTFQMAGNSFGTFSGFVRVGQDSTVKIGNNVTTTNSCVISAVEGTTVSIGEDVMLASDNEIRADDGHAIFDIDTETRVNNSKDIHIGNHVWVAKRAVVLGGAQIGDGSVIGFGAIVTGRVPNNCVAAGIPARIVRRDVAWERPHLSRTRPYYKPDASTVKKSDYWHKTEVPNADNAQEVTVVSVGQRFAVRFGSEAEAESWIKKVQRDDLMIVPLMASRQAVAMIETKE